MYSFVLSINSRNLRLAVQGNKGTSAHNKLVEKEKLIYIKLAVAKLEWFSGTATKSSTRMFTQMNI